MCGNTGNLLIRSAVWHDPDVRRYREIIYALAADPTNQAGNRGRWVTAELRELSCALQRRYPLSGYARFQVWHDVDAVRQVIPLMLSAVPEYHAFTAASHRHAPLKAEHGSDHAETIAAAAGLDLARRTIHQNTVRRGRVRMRDYLTPDYGVPGLCLGPPPPANAPT